LTTYLLDTNVLLALAHPRHIHFGSARSWFTNAGRADWTTCPITENGFLRIASQPTYPNRPGDSSAVRVILSRLRSAPGWHFWADDVSLLDVIDPDTTIPHSQITDLYLLGLAAHKGGKLATLDSRINASAVRGGRQALFVIPAG